MCVCVGVKVGTSNVLMWSYIVIKRVRYFYILFLKEGHQDYRIFHKFWIIKKKKINHYNRIRHLLSLSFSR